MHIAAAAQAAALRAALAASLQPSCTLWRYAFQYETRAKECDDMANATRDLNQKQLWLAVARHWHELADKIRRLDLGCGLCPASAGQQRPAVHLQPIPTPKTPHLLPPLSTSDHLGTTTHHPPPRPPLTPPPPSPLSPLFDACLRASLAARDFHSASRKPHDCFTGFSPRCVGRRIER